MKSQETTLYKKEGENGMKAATMTSKFVEIYEVNNIHSFSAAAAYKALISSTSS